MLNNEEIHLVALLLENVELCVKLENLLGSDFKTNIGSPQGDGASALFFITYLAKSLKKKLLKKRRWQYTKCRTRFARFRSKNCTRTIRNNERPTKSE